jgi:hypothetical protein
MDLHSALVQRRQCGVRCRQPVVGVGSVSNLTLNRRVSCEAIRVKTADFYQSTADAMGVALYLYPDGSVTNTPKVCVEPTATIEPHARWRAADDHGLGEQMRKA